LRKFVIVFVLKKFFFFFEKVAEIFRHKFREELKGRGHVVRKRREIRKNA